MIKKMSVQVLLWGLILILAIPFGAFAQNTAPPASPQFKQEELDQMLAPIALYPDSLLVQILMASTYPLEIVEAARWAKANQNLKGDPLTTALEKQNWDPSVKSLINFPSVLAMMNDKLDWILTVFYFRPDLVATYDAFKLVLLSLSLTLPALVVNILLGASFLGADKEKLMPVMAGFGFSSLAFFAPLGVVVLVGLQWRAYAGLVCVAELTIVLWVVRRNRKAKNRTHHRTERAVSTSPKPVEGSSGGPLEERPLSGKTEAE